MVVDLADTVVVWNAAAAALFDSSTRSRASSATST